MTIEISKEIQDKLDEGNYWLELVWKANGIPPGKHLNKTREKLKEIISDPSSELELYLYMVGVSIIVTNMELHNNSGEEAKKRLTRETAKWLRNGLLAQVVEKDPVLEYLPEPLLSLLSGVQDLEKVEKFLEADLSKYLSSKN